MRFRHQPPAGCGCPQQPVGCSPPAVTGRRPPQLSLWRFRCSLARSLPPASPVLSGGRMTNKLRSVLPVMAIGIVAALRPGAAQAPPSPDQLVGALKQNLAASEKRLRQYEWVETTAIS